MDALIAHGLPVNSEWIIHSGFSQEDGENDTSGLLNLPDPPDAVFAVNDRKAIGAMLALKRKKIAIGREVGVVGFTNDPMSKIISPTLTTMAELHSISDVSAASYFSSIFIKHHLSQKKLFFRAN